MHDGTFGSFKTSRKERVDIRVGVERRRRWPRGEKLRIVRESLEPNAVVSEVARRNDISASLIYVWRRQALAGLLEGFHRVEVVSDTPLPLITADTAVASAVTANARDMTAPPACYAGTEALAPPVTRGAIEVTLPGGTIVRVDGAVDVKALRTVLGALVR